MALNPLIRSLRPRYRSRAVSLRGLLLAYTDTETQTKSKEVWRKSRPSCFPPCRWLLCLAGPPSARVQRSHQHAYMYRSVLLRVRSRQRQWPSSERNLSRARRCRRRRRRPRPASARRRPARTSTRTRRCRWLTPSLFFACVAYGLPVIPSTCGLTHARRRWKSRVRTRRTSSSSRRRCLKGQPSPRVVSTSPVRRRARARTSSASSPRAAKQTRPSVLAQTLSAVPSSWTVYVVSRWLALTTLHADSARRL
jgi:hypothetical protein